MAPHPPDTPRPPDPDDEAAGLAGRLRRYAQVGGRVGGLAARLAGQRLLGMEPSAARDAADLRAVLGGLKGPLMKVAQILSTIPEALPPEYVLELTQLQSDAPPMGWAFVKRRMSSELGPDWRARFQSFEHEAAAAASLGQVHRAVGLDGRQLAVKLQYPDMASTVAADLAQLKLAFAIYRRLDRAIDTRHVLAELTERLMEELDYQREARHMRLYRLMLKDEPAVHVPEPLEDLSTRRLLTMTWEEGAKLLTLRDAAQEARDQMARAMFRAWYVPFYQYGVIHGDPHLGNYSARPDLGLNLLDFGCIRVFAPKFVQGVIDLYHALERDDRALAVHAYETWGFTGLSADVIDTLNLWAEFIYSPLLDNRRRTIHEGPGGIYGRGVADKVHARLRELGGVTPPKEFVLMDRAAIGLGSVFLHLKARINWHETFFELIEGFDAEALGQRQERALLSVGLL